MPFTFQISFSFLCAFVPERPFDDVDPPKNCQVLLRDLRDIDAIDDGAPAQSCGRPKKHFPVLTFKKIDVDWDHSTLSPDRIQVEETDFEKMTYFEGEELHISIDGEDPVSDGLHCVFNRPSQGTSEVGDIGKPLRQEEHSLYWLADPKRWGQDLQVAQEFLQGAGSSGAPIAGRVHLTDGELYTADRTASVWSIKDDNGDPLHSQFLATVVVYERRNVQEFVELRLRSFGGDISTLHLRPAFNPTSVDVYVRNSENDRRFGPVNDTYGSKDCDFRLFYRLAGANATGRVWEPPVENNSDDGPCSPVVGGKGGGD